ncbi:MAG: type II toxin-antitoxin system RelB/DinJ family antitoxin [Spirochaetaceae bacterium]|jgi:DNA-damage-inducible protein J|nr:type II toxin-antitoxin system RelB/DinJ family antitoxin [Spirochaetaceae bacterium]
MAQISIRIDDTVKKQADSLFEELGLTLSGAVNIFVRQALRQRGIPFPVSVENEPFFNPANMRWIDQSIEQMRKGQKITKSFAELEQMAT